MFPLLWSHLSQSFSLCDLSCHPFVMSYILFLSLLHPLSFFCHFIIFFVTLPLPSVLRFLSGYCDVISFCLSLQGHFCPSFCDVITVFLSLWYHSGAGKVPVGVPDGDGRGLPSMHQAAVLHALPGLHAPRGWGKRSEVTVQPTQTNVES